MDQVTQIHIVHINTTMVAFVLGATFTFMLLNLWLTGKNSQDGRRRKK